MTLRSLGWLMLLMTMTTRCVIPQDDRELVLPPDYKNRPPRLIESSARPVSRIVTNNNLSNCRLDFSIYVEDPDLDDLITVNWYIDYDAQANPAYYGLQRRLANNGSAVRPDPASLSVDFTSANPLTVGSHLVEVLVSDGPLLNRDPQARSLPDGRSEPSYSAVWSWLVRVDPVSCP